MGMGVNWLFLLAAMIACVCDFAAADGVTFGDIFGTFETYRGNECGSSLKITGSTTGVMKHEQFQVDKKPCTSGSIKFVPDVKGHDNWSAWWSRAAGRVLRGVLDGRLVCNRARFAFAHIVRPRKLFSMPLFGTVDEEFVEYHVGWVHVTLMEPDVGCVYRRRLPNAVSNNTANETENKAHENTEVNSAPANAGNKPNDRVNSNGNQGTQSDGKVSGNGVQIETGGNRQNSNGSKEGPWYWLGPVMGSVATLLAAVITLCTCHFRGKTFQHPIHGAVLPHLTSSSISSHTRPAYSIPAVATAGSSDAHLASVSSNLYSHAMQGPWSVQRKGPQYV